MSNFDFLNNDLADLSEMGRNAEAHLYSYNLQTLSWLRIFASKVARNIAVMEGLITSLDDNESFRKPISEKPLSIILFDEGIIPESIYFYFNEIRQKERWAVHNRPVREEQVIQQLVNAHALACWFYKKYYFDAFEPQPFVLPK